MICLESMARGWTRDRHLALLETSPVSNIQFWKPVYQMFKLDESLMNAALQGFYVWREDSPVDGLINLLLIDDMSGDASAMGVISLRILDGVAYS